MGIDQLAVALGLTPRQAYRRISAARPLLCSHLRRDENGELQVDSSGLEILLQIETRRREGESMKEAILQITEEVILNSEVLWKSNGCENKLR